MLNWLSIWHCIIRSMASIFLGELLMYWLYLLKVCLALDKSGKSRTVALDMSKAFKRVWHICLLLSSKNYCISGHIFELIQSFLSNLSMKVIVNSFGYFFANTGEHKALAFLLLCFEFLLTTFQMTSALKLVSMPLSIVNLGSPIRTYWRLI